MITFTAEKLKQARNAGYSDDEIWGFAAQQDERFNKAKEAGYSLDEVSGFLSQQEQEQPAAMPVAKPTLEVPPAPEPLKIEAPKPQEGILRKAADIPVGLLAGTTGVLKSVADVFGADSPASQQFAERERFWNNLISESGKEKQKRAAEIQKTAQDKGVWEQAKAAAQAFAEAPTLMLATGAGSLAPLIVAGAAAPALGGGATAVTGTQVGIGTLMGAGAVKGGIYEQVKQNALDAGKTPEEAEKLATEAQSYGENPEQIIAGGALGALASATGIEATAGRAISGAARKLATGAQIVGRNIAEEVITEMPQQAQQRIAQNIAAQKAGFNVPTFQGVAGEATTAGIIAAGLGGIAGGIDAVAASSENAQKVKLAVNTQSAAQQTSEITPLTSSVVIDQAEEVGRQAATDLQTEADQKISETPEQRVARLKAEAQAAREITLEEQPPVAGLPIVEPTPPVAPTPEAAVAPVEPVVPTEEVAQPPTPEAAPTPEIAQAAQARITEREGRAATPVETPTGTRVEAAAYQAPDGTVYYGQSHLDAMAKARDAGKIDQAAIDAKQEVTSRETPEFGFATNADPFVSRDQAETIARQSGQITVEQPATGKLHSNEVSLDAFAQPVTPTPTAALAGQTVPQSTSLKILGKEDTRAEYARLEAEGMTREEAIADLQKRKEADKKAIRDSVSQANIGDIIRVTEDDGTVVDYEIVGETTMRGTRLGIKKADGSGTSYGLEVDSGVPAHGIVAGGTIIKRSDWNAEQKAKAAPTPEAAPAAVEPTPVTPPVTPQLEPLRRVARAEQTEEDVAGLVDSGFVEVYKGQPVITQAGLEALPEAERPRLTPEARKIQIDTRTSEAAAEAISKNLRIGVDQVPVDVRMPEGWTLVGDVYVPPQPQAATPAPTPEVREARREPAITTQQDRDYLDAVERGDLDAASRLVEDAANLAGYTQKWFHGTAAKAFNVFRDFGRNFIYFTQDRGDAMDWAKNNIEYARPEYAQGETPTPRVVEAFINADNIFNRTNEKHMNRVVDLMSKSDDRSVKNQTPQQLRESLLEENYEWYEEVAYKFIRQAGFDGAYIFESQDFDPYNLEEADLGILNPNLIKSADPVTRDDQGNIIPPSQRFQPEQADIRYARRERQLANSLDSGDFVSAQALVDGGATMDRATFLRSITPSATQRATTIHTRLERDGIISKDEFANEKGLVYGDGRGAASAYLGAESYEPFPPAGFVPDYSGDRVAGQGAPIDKKFRTILNTFVLNVVDPQTRSFIVKDIANLLENGGRAVFVTRGKDVANSKALVSFGPLERIQRSEGKLTYQKGFTQPELIQYLQETLGDGFEVRALRGGSASDVRVEVVKNTDATLDNPPIVPEARERRRVQMGRAGMEPSAVEARLQELGFPAGGIIRVVNEPDADFEGRTIIVDGKVTGIELNSAAMMDNATIDRVLNHEFAESANADGALNKLVERLTPKEKKEINDTITRLRYEERARTTEEAARAIETLAEAWRGRGFFTRAVARVEAWASKLGFKLTRRAAEYIAARNLAEVNENVRKWNIGEAMANIKGARKVSFNGLQAVLIPPSEMRVAYSIAAYHGTPHEIKGGFQLAKIGTGEGATAYGWGLYFAENISVAQEYREKLVRRIKDPVRLNGEAINRGNLVNFDDQIDKDTYNGLIKIFQDRKDSDFSGREQAAQYLESVGMGREANALRSSSVDFSGGIGNLYTVSLDLKEDEILDWDKPLSEQNQKVKQAIKSILPEELHEYVDSNLRGEWAYVAIRTYLSGKYDGPKSIYSVDLQEWTKSRASLALAEQGLKATRYLDQVSRIGVPQKTGLGWMVDDQRGTKYFKTKAEAEEYSQQARTANFVVFDENAIKITGLNGQPVDIRESRREPEAIPTFTEGTPEAATLKEMATSMSKVDAASEAKGGKPETYKISEIASVWMDSGLGERELQDAITEYTNLTPANAKRVARAIAKQYDTQQQLAEAVLETEAGVTVEGLPEGMEIPKDVDPKNKRTVLQRVIDATTGVRVKPVILQVPEKSALKEQIRMKARETREAKKAQQETADAVVEAIKALELRGPMRAKQAQALAKRAAKVIWTSEKSMENFIAYAERVMANTNYDADLREAKAAQKRAKELSKRDSIAAPQRFVLEAIGNIGINLLNDPREFADVVNHYLRSFKPVVSEAYVVVPDSEMESYLSMAEDEVNESKAEFDVEDNEKLAEKYGVSVNDLQRFLDAEDIMDALESYAKREAIEGILNEKSSGVKEALKGVDTTTLRADQRKLIDAMKVIDVKSLDSAEKQSYIRIGNNIIFNNNQTNGAEFFVATAKGQQSARDLAKNTAAMTKNRAWANILPSLGSRKAKKLLKSWASELQSIADTFRNAFGKEAMTVFYEAMGMVDLDLGFTQAARTLEEIQEKMAKFYDKLGKKYKGAATNQDGILSEGIVGYLIQNVPAKGEADSLAQRRGLMQQNVANLRKSGDEDKIQMADRIQQLMQRLDGNTVDQMLSNLKREYPANYESLMWLKDELFPQYKDFLKFSDENFNDQANNYNTPNYLPIIYSNASPALDLLQGKKKYYDNLSSSPKQSSYTIKRSDYTQLPMGSDGRTPKEIGLNLRKNAYNSLSDQITRAYTNPARQRIYSFLKTPEAEEALGGKANLDFFADRIERLMGSRERRGSFNEGFFGKAVDVLANLGRDIGTRIALAGSYQLIRQPADQVTVAVGATGRADLMAEHLAPRSIKNARPVLDLFSIGRRGDASSGYKYINQMEGAQSRLERYYTEGNWVKAKEAATRFADKFMAPLKVSDFTVAAATWMTFYRAYLAKNGIKFTTWEDAAKLIKSDNAGHKRAAAYAENMTDIYQGSSDPTKMAVFAQKGKTGSENLLKAILVPFNSFGVQFRARVSSDLTEIFTKSGDWKERALAVKDLSATIGGTVMFGLAKRFVLPSITYGGIKILYAIFGVDVEEPDEEKQKEEFDQKWRQLQGDIISTMVVGGFGQMVESYTIDGMNYLKYMIDTANESESVLDDDGEIMSFNEYARERAPFYRYRSFDNAFSLGILDIGMDQAKKSILNTKMVLTPEEMDKFTPEEQRFLYAALISDWLYLGGFNDADFARMWDKGRRDMIKARKEEEKELKRIREGR